MIKEFKETKVRESGVIYNSTFEQIKMLYQQDKEKAGELAISAIEMVLTGEISSDDFTVKLVLENLRVISEKNKQKYDKKISTQKQKKVEEMKLEEIAALYNQGLKQKEIGLRLGIPQQTVSYRLQIIKAEYPNLILYQNTKNTKNTNTDNVNDNDNDNDKKEFGATHQSLKGSGANAPIPKTKEEAMRMLGF